MANRSSISVVLRHGQRVSPLSLAAATTRHGPVCPPLACSVVLHPPGLRCSRYGGHSILTLDAQHFPFPGERQGQPREYNARSRPSPTPVLATALYLQQRRPLLPCFSLGRAAVCRMVGFCASFFSAPLSALTVMHPSRRLRLLGPLPARLHHVLRHVLHHVILRLA